CNDESRPRIKNVSFEDNQYDGLSCLDHCDLRCDVNGGTQYHNFQVPQYSTTFWVYLALRIPAQFFLASAMTMMDALTMAVIENRGGDFGKQRLMSMLSLASMPFISSAIVHNAPTDNGSPDYTIAFYFGDVLLVIAVIVTAYIDLERPETPSRNVLKDLRQLLTTLDIVVFLAVILVLGSNWGFLESFFFVYLSELKAPAYMLGLTLTFGCLVGIPAMFLSNRIINSLGRANIFILSFVAYSVRMFGYSFITNPWMSLPFEALEVITYQLMWVAAVTYFPILAPPTLLATMSGLSGTLHYNVGRGVGALLGGHLMGGIGSVNTFRVFGIISLVCGIIYAILHYSFLRAKL
ncbi:Major facilitator superfamily associated domain, partial [Trinorchestia longiramus]